MAQLFAVYAVYNTRIRHATGWPYTFVFNSRILWPNSRQRQTWKWALLGVRETGSGSEQKKKKLKFRQSRKFWLFSLSLTSLSVPQFAVSPGPGGVAEVKVAGSAKPQDPIFLSIQWGCNSKRADILWLFSVCCYSGTIVEVGSISLKWEVSGQRAEMRNARKLQRER